MGDNKRKTTGKDNTAHWMNLNNIPPGGGGGGSNHNVVIDVPSKYYSRRRVIDEAEKKNNGVNVNFPPTSSAVNVMHADSVRDIPRDELVGIHNSEASNTNHDKDSNALEATQSGQRLNNNNGKAPMSLSRFMQSDEENCSVPVVKEEALSLSSHDGGESSSKVCEPPTVTVDVPGLRSSQEVLSRASMFQRMRRSRITELLRSLQELLPHFEGGGRESVLDGTIEYIKCLQLQFKTLSQSRLGGEASHDPFVYLEGYGHYLFHDEMLSSPLEEIIGKLMEFNMPLLYQLLESKGLAVMPMGLTGGLLQ